MFLLRSLGFFSPQRHSVIPFRNSKYKDFHSFAAVISPIFLPEIEEVLMAHLLVSVKFMKFRILKYTFFKIQSEYEVICFGMAEIKGVTLVVY